MKQTSATSRCANRASSAARLHLRHRSRAGFSIVELMVIVILLGVLASVIFVSLQGLIPRAELNSAVRDLSATLFQARSEAISRNAEFKIEYYFEAGDGHPRGYRIVTPFRAGGGEGGLAAFDDERHAMTWHTLPDSIEFQRITLNNEDIDSGQVVVRFDPLGAASDHSITLVQHPYENVYTIEVLALTGLIRFHDGEYEREYPEHGDFN